MIEVIKNWCGPLEINGVHYNNTNDCNDIIDNLHGEVSILLIPDQQDSETEATEYVVRVKPYMTKRATPEFDFMKKWNQDIPMPLRVMVGTKVKETRGMVYMKLHGDILEERTTHCMKCGKPITNPVSQYFGMGPECGGHNYVNPFSTREELEQAVASYRKRLQHTVWEGWIIKSAILEMEVKEK